MIAPPVIDPFQFLAALAVAGIACTVLGVALAAGLACRDRLGTRLARRSSRPVIAAR